MYGITISIPLFPPFVKGDNRGLLNEKNQELTFNIEKCGEETDKKLLPFRFLKLKFATLEKIKAKNLLDLLYLTLTFAKRKIKL